ncbi:OmpA family protein [Motiliproteus sp. SC1-56]|uniref:OmpA family protein n=1 Tax=Motiliproteus sp. SC1-56 TaxID=2799565 RepID=UPI001A8E4C42|nr:OmpA family protein [Motiliproteus sp. SC1-56]
MNRTSSIGLADLMSALMMTFLFIAIAFLAKLEQSTITFVEKLNHALHEEFDPDLQRWKAEITPDNVVRFHSPFKLGSNEIPEVFKAVISEFCPRYIRVLASDNLKQGIKEVKVEGHTSHGWNKGTASEDAFINNMRLSQERATNVLSYCYLMEDPVIKSNRDWLEKNFHANGLAYSKPIYIKGRVSSRLSRRVDFMVIPKINGK